MKKKPTEPTHGGARTGAGKKPKIGPKRVTKSFTLDQETADYLATLENASGDVEKLIQKSKGFKDWQLTKDQS